MKRTILSLAALALGTSFAMAQVTPPAFADIDADASGTLSFEEVTAVWTDLTIDQFGAADTNADGALDEAEFTAFTEAMAASS